MQDQLNNCVYIYIHSCAVLVLSVKFGQYGANIGQYVTNIGQYGTNIGQYGNNIGQYVTNKESTALI